jgi:hypothetical protein
MLMALMVMYAVDKGKGKKKRQWEEVVLEPRPAEEADELDD